MASVAEDSMVEVEEHFSFSSIFFDIMNMNKALITILLFLILFLAVSSVSADDDKSYTIDQAFIDLTVKSNGLLHVDEKFDYTFK